MRRNVRGGASHATANIIERADRCIVFVCICIYIFPRQAKVCARAFFVSRLYGGRALSPPSVSHFVCSVHVHTHTRTQVL